MLQLLLKWPIFERQRQKLFSGHKREKAQYPFSYSLCKHTLDQVHPTFCVQRIDRSLSLIKNHRSLGITFVVVAQSFSHVRLFVTPWITACQAPLSFTISQSLLKFMSIEAVIPSNHLILCRPVFLLPSIFPSIRVFANESDLQIR